MGNGDEPIAQQLDSEAQRPLDGAGDQADQPASQPAPQRASNGQFTSTNQPRGRGRPKGSTNKSKSKSRPKPATSSAGGQDDPLRLRTDVAAKAKAAAAAPVETPPSSSGLADGDAAQVSGLVVMLANTAACMAFGPEAAINADEVQLIQPAVSRMLARVSPAAVERFGSLADPLMLATGFGIWGIRIFGLVEARKAADRARAAQLAAEAAASVSTNGHAPLHPTDDGSGYLSTNGYAATGAAPPPVDISAHMGGLDEFGG